MSKFISKYLQFPLAFTLSFGYLVNSPALAIESESMCSDDDENDQYEFGASNDELIEMSKNMLDQINIDLLVLEHFISVYRIKRAAYEYGFHSLRRDIYNKKREPINKRDKWSIPCPATPKILMCCRWAHRTLARLEALLERPYTNETLEELSQIYQKLAGRLAELETYKKNVTNYVAKD